MLRVKGQAATEGFAIEHFAGSVTYTTKLWLDKNKDPLNGDLMVLMQVTTARHYRLLHCRHRHRHHLHLHLTSSIPLPLCSSRTTRC